MPVAFAFNSAVGKLNEELFVIDITNKYRLRFTMVTFTLLSDARDG